MATRVYFPETGAAPVTPPTIGAEWEHDNNVTRQLIYPTPDSTTLTTTAYTPDAADDITDRDACHRRYVSNPLKAQTFGGNVKGQFQCLEAHTNNNLFLTLKILVCTNTGSSVVVTPLAITRDTTNEVATTLTNRNFPSTALSAVACNDGDRLVIEVGLGGLPVATSQVQGHNGSIRFGTNASGGDLTEDDTSTSTTLRPWVEFSQNIKWLGDADGSASGLATVSAAGVALWDGAGSAAGTSTVSSAGVALWDAVASSAGVATVVSDGQLNHSHPVTKITQLATSATPQERYASFTGKPNVSEGAGSANGVSTVTGVGAYFFQGVGASVGISTVSGSSVSVLPTLAASAGISTVSAPAVALWDSVFSSAGVGTALADGENSAAPAITVNSDYTYRRRGRR